MLLAQKLDGTRGICFGILDARCPRVFFEVKCAVCGPCNAEGFSGNVTWGYPGALFGSLCLDLCGLCYSLIDFKSKSKGRGVGFHTRALKS